MKRYSELALSINFNKKLKILDTAKQEPLYLLSGMDNRNEFSAKCDCKIEIFPAQSQYKRLYQKEEIRTLSSILVPLKCNHILQVRFAQIQRKLERPRMNWTKIAK
jgi:hypothetical protein